MVITDAAIRAARTRWMERDDDSAIRAINLVIQRGDRSTRHGRPRIQLGTRVLHLIEDRVTDATVTGMRHATNLYRRAKRDARERRKGATP